MIFGLPEGFGLGVGFLLLALEFLLELAAALVLLAELLGEGLFFLGGEVEALAGLAEVGGEFLALLLERLSLLFGQFEGRTGFGEAGGGLLEFLVGLGQLLFFGLERGFELGTLIGLVVEGEFHQFEHFLGGILAQGGLVDGLGGGFGFKLNQREDADEEEVANDEEEGFVHGGGL